MRRCLALVAAVAALAGVAVLTSQAADAAARSTTVTVVRPVSAAGHPAAGYRVVNERGVLADCSSPSSSPAAVNRDILYCSPSAAVAQACWRAAWAHHVLCLDNARTKTLMRLRVAGRIAHSAPPKIAWPLDLRLGNGAYCSLRDGGADAGLKGHPMYAQTYYCSNGTSLWAKYTARNGDINRSHAIWTVQASPSNGRTGVLHTREVVRAWFVGTAA